MRQHHITGLVLSTMTKNDWIDLGIIKFGDIRTIQTALEQLMM
jgi:hypothetical protein